MAACPPFRIKRSTSGDVHLFINQRRAYVWRAGDLQAHAVKNRVELLEDLLRDGATWEALERIGGVTEADYRALVASQSVAGAAFCAGAGTKGEDGRRRRTHAGGNGPNA